MSTVLCCDRCGYPADQLNGVDLCTGCLDQIDQEIDGRHRERDEKGGDR